VTEPALRFAGVGKSYGSARVLADLNLEIAEGEFFVLLGPSGCGKTTLLRMTAGLQPIDRGEIYLRGAALSPVPPERRNIAMVFQDYALYPHMTVYQNMAFGLRRHGHDRSETDARVRRTAALLGIESLLERRPHQISGGQQQRVALGRAIARDPVLYLMDEPLSNLDAQVRASVRTEIKELQRRLGVTTLYVTHDQVEAMTLGDRMAVLNDGVIQQVGRPIDVYREPANEFVARFLATPQLNVFDGTLERINGAVVVRTQVGAFAWTQPPAALPENPKVRVGMRPEEIKISFDVATEGASLPIRLIEPLGSQILVIADFDGGELTVSVPADAMPRDARRIAVVPAGCVVHLFDCADGKAIGHFSAGSS
jgi:multiple sugar transport system ATP-binding protein